MGKKPDDFDERIEKFIKLLQKESGAPYEACKKEAYQWISLFSGLRQADEHLRNREQKWQAALDILPGILQSIESHIEAFEDLLNAAAVQELRDHIDRFYGEASVSNVERRAANREFLKRKRGGQFDADRQTRLIVIGPTIEDFQARCGGEILSIKAGWMRLKGKKASIQTPRDDIKPPKGPFMEILKAFFLLFGLHLSPNTLKEDFYRPERPERKRNTDRRKIKTIQ